MLFFSGCFEMTVRRIVTFYSFLDSHEKSCDFVLFWIEWLDAVLLKLFLDDNEGNCHILYLSWFTWKVMWLCSFFNRKNGMKGSMSSVTAVLFHWCLCEDQVKCFVLGHSYFWSLTENHMMFGYHINLKNWIYLIVIWLFLMFLKTNFM